MFDQYRDIFNQRGALYHQAMLECPLARREEFETVLQLADLRDGLMIADIPSGGCYLESYISDDVRITSVETSAEFIRAAGDSTKSTSILCENPTNIPLPGQRFDRVISLAGAHHLSDQCAFYREVYRLLKSEGVFVLADVRAGTGVDRFLNEFINQHNSMGHQGNFLAAATRDKLEAAGFDVVHDQPMSYHWNFGSEKEMVLFCRKLFGIDRANEAQILSGIQDCVGYCSSNDACRMNWELYFFKAVKSKR